MKLFSAIPATPSRLISLFFLLNILASAQPSYAQPSPVIPMTAITGKPDRTAVREMLCAYKDTGIDQFLIYPRSGLELEYMGPEWMAFCRNCLELADSLDMKVWLYDEYNWPSGNCKGQVTADGNEDFYPKLLVSDGSNIRIVSKKTGADLLNPDAVARFIKLTHERYYREFKEYFGRVIVAIFTDEPSFCYAASGPEAGQALVWYPGLEEDYSISSGGRKLKEDFNNYLQGDIIPELWSNYYNVIGERMRSSYTESLSRWCREHGISLTGHLMYEKLYKSVRCNGNPLKQLSLFDIPGFDEANSDIDIRAMEMEISGLALSQYAGRDKAGEMCELYSVGPADLTMSHMRQLMWMCSAFGINNYIVAVASMDARGNKEKGDWYFHSGRTQPWFDYYRQFVPEAVRAAGFARKPYEPQLRVRVPFRYFMSLDKTPAFEERGKMYLRFLEALLSHQMQFLLMDEDETDPSGRPTLSFGPDGFHIEGETERYYDMESLMARACELAPRRVVVSDSEGRETRDVLVRYWADGSISLVDLTDDDGSDRLLTVKTDDAEGRVRLFGHGAFSGRIEEMRDSMPTAAVDLEMKNTRLTPHGPNMLRCLYTMDNPVYEFTAETDIKNLRIIQRIQTDAPELKLDGSPITATLPAEGLPEGFRQLYSMTEKLKLKKGKHRLEITNGVKDYRYLPSVFLSGEFSASRDGILKAGYPAQEDPMSIIPDFAGIFDLDADIKLPKDAETLCLDVNLACTELFLDGKSLGRKAWAPYEWELPRGCSGKHHITIRISRSIMPLFGDIKRLDKDQPYISWLRIKPGIHGDKTLIKTICRYR